MEGDSGGAEDAEDPGGEPIRFHDASSSASDPVPVVVAQELLRRACPQLYGWAGRKAVRKRQKAIIIEHMRFGDSRAAVVVSTSPLLVAAYTDELDCVAMLRFAPAPPVSGLNVGSRLLTVNTYKRGMTMDADLFPGPLSIGRYAGFYPIIADFICANQAVVDRRKAEIEPEEWERTSRFGEEYLSTHPRTCRNGAPCMSLLPG